VSVKVGTKYSALFLLMHPSTVGGPEPVLGREEFTEKG